LGEKAQRKIIGERKKDAESKKGREKSGTCFEGSVKREARVMRQPCAFETPDDVHTVTDVGDSSLRSRGVAVCAAATRRTLSLLLRSLAGVTGARLALGLYLVLKARTN